MPRGAGGHSPASVMHSLKGIDFPANLKKLLQHAKRNDAEPEVLEELEKLPDQEYGSMAEVMKGYGKRH